MLRELVNWFAGRREIYRVRGSSMLPTLGERDLVWVDPSSRATPPLDRIVVVPDPQDCDRTLIKRVRSKGENTFAVGSDNPNEGRDSRHFGSIKREKLIGLATVAWCWGRGGRWFVDLRDA